MVLVRKKEFATICGISQPAVTWQLKNGGLTETIDGYIDTNSDKCQEYLALKGIDLSAFPDADPQPARNRSQKKKAKKNIHITSVIADCKKGILPVKV